MVLEGAICALFFAFNMNVSFDQIEAIARAYARESFVEYAQQLNPNLKMTPFHSRFYQILDLFARGIIKNLLITVPPQHGKSEGSTRLLPSYILGRRPNCKIAIGSYSGTFARKFNRSVQRYIDSPTYAAIFPNTYLSGSANAEDKGGYMRNSQEFEIVGHRGGLKAVGRGGQLTGDPVDVMIMDDLYKDMKEGNSPIIRAGVIEWLDGVVDQRLHNDSQQLMTFTRWHEDDAIGYIEANENVVTVGSIQEIYDAIAKDPDVWIKVNFEAIKESEPTELDPRERGTALWEERHGIKKHLRKRARNKLVFECMNQGNPSSKEGLLYGDFKTYDELPTTIKKRGNYTDTADQGTDYLCSISYVVDMDGKIYVTDIVYTQEPMEKTEVYVPLMLTKNDIREARIESNNGGRGFARVVDKKAPFCKVDWFFQGENKEARILTNAATVTELVHMPADWATRWPTFYNHLKGYKRLFKANTVDDCADAVTGVVETETAKKKGTTRRRN
jgi:predicted phage terminase large subunit-like protein